MDKLKLRKGFDKVVAFVIEARKKNDPELHRLYEPLFKDVDNYIKTEEGIALLEKSKVKEIKELVKRLKANGQIHSSQDNS